MALKMKKKSLADRINSLVTTTPATFNSDDEAEDTKAKVVDYDESDNSDINFQVSEIRRRNVDPLDQIDKRYKGKKVSRQDAYNDDDNDDFDSQDISESEDERMDSMEEQTDGDFNDSDDEENIDDSIENDESDGNIEEDSNKSDNSGEELSNEEEEELSNKEEEELSNEENEELSNEEEEELSNEEDEELSNEEEEELSNEEDEELSNEEDEKDESNISFAKQGKDIQTMSQTNARADIEKGNCVRSQLKLWESLLEVRIKLQKCLTTSNQMPQHDVYQNFKGDTEYVKTADETKSKLKALLNNMLQLQTFLLKQYPETKNLSTRGKKRKAEDSIDEEMENSDDPMDEEIPSDTDDENEDRGTISEENTVDFDESAFKKKLKLGNYEKILSDNHKSYREYSDSVIQKWNEKTRIATGKLNKGTSETTLKQIEFALNDKEKLRKRSRLKRSEYQIIGKAEAPDDNDGRRVQEYDSEIYDDDDFYHQLLRDLIEHKSSDITDPIQLSKQWIQLQNMRNKIKKKIDTRATKGRRIRYNVHNKLVNFMAPIAVNDTWTDHAKDELCNSLFGKIKPAVGEVGR